MDGLLELPVQILGGLWEVVRDTPVHVLGVILIGLLGLGLGLVSFVLSFLLEGGIGDYSYEREGERERERERDSLRWN